MIESFFCIEYCVSNPLEDYFPCDDEWVSCYIWCDKYCDCSDCIDMKWCVKQGIPYWVMRSQNQSLIEALSWADRIIYIMRHGDNEMKSQELTEAQRVWYFLKKGSGNATLNMYQDWFDQTFPDGSLGPDPTVTLPPVTPTPTAGSLKYSKLIFSFKLSCQKCYVNITYCFHF